MPAGPTPPALCGRWIHSHEEDDGDAQVFRPSAPCLPALARPALPRPAPRRLAARDARRRGRPRGRGARSLGARREIALAAVRGRRAASRPRPRARGGLARGGSAGAEARRAARICERRPRSEGESVDGYELGRGHSHADRPRGCLRDRGGGGARPAAAGLPQDAALPARALRHRARPGRGHLPRLRGRALELRRGDGAGRCARRRAGLALRHRARRPRRDRDAQLPRMGRRLRGHHLDRRHQRVAQRLVDERGARLRPARFGQPAGDRRRRARGAHRAAAARAATSA